MIEMDISQFLTPKKLETVKVASLTDKRDRWKICVKVKRKFEKKISVNKKEYFKVVLMDDSGTIEALAFGSQNVDKFFSKFEKNQVYIILNGKVRKVNQTFSNIHGYEILLTAETSVTLCEDMERQSIAKMQHTPGLTNVMSPRLGVTSQQAPGTTVTSHQAPLTSVTSHQVTGITVTSHQVTGTSVTSHQVTGTTVTSHQAPLTSVTSQQAPGTSGTSQQTPGMSVTSQQTPGTSGTSQQAPGTSDTSHQAPGTIIKNLQVPGTSGTDHQASGTNVTCHQATRDSIRRRQASRLSVLYTPLSMLNQTNKATVDVFGKVTGVWKVEAKYKNIVVRKLNISDLDRTDLKVALLNRQAVEFRTSCIDSSIALKKMRVKNINGYIELESTKETEIEYNPLSPKALGLNDVIDLTDENMSVSVIDRNSKDTQSTECKNVNIPQSNNFVRLLKRKGLCEVLRKAGNTRKTTSGKAADSHDVGEGKKTSASGRLKRKSSRNLKFDIKVTDVKSNKESNKVDVEKEKVPSEVDREEDMTDGRIIRSDRKIGDNLDNNLDNKLDMEHEDFSLPGTPAQSDSDGEQPIKPVSSTKKRQKVASSDSEDTDSTMSYTVSPGKQGSSGSLGKRSHQSDDESDDEKGLTNSEKKRFKRIKEIKFSQESNQVDDQEDAESNEEDDPDNSDTSASHSDDDSDDGDDDDTNWLRNRSDGGREDIERLRDIREDDDGTKQLFRHYLLWMAMTAGGESCDGEEFEETVDAKCKLEGRLEVAMGVCQSQAWSDSVRKDIRMYPEFVDGKTHDGIMKGDIEMIEKCQVCNREDHPWEIIITLKGNPYNRKTFEEEEADEDEDFLRVEYFMGRFCHPRTKLFHKLYHFGYHLYSICKSMLEDGKTIDEIATDVILQNKMCDKLRRWLKEVEEDYTDDGVRANKRWRKEFEDFI